MAERPEREIRQYACCTDNLKAAKVFSIINFILDIVGISLAVIFVVIPAIESTDSKSGVSTFLKK